MTVLPESLFPGPIVLAAMNIRVAMILLGVTIAAVAVVPGAAAYSDGSCWDSGDGRGCHWAQGQGWYGCTFGGVYNSEIIAGASVCNDRVEIAAQQW